MRKLILDNLPDGYVETMNWGMISYEIPLSRYPETHNGKPLAYVGLAAQKNAYSLYLMCLYGDTDQEDRLRKAFEREGKKLDMGKSCIRFRDPDALALDALGDVIRSTPPDRYIRIYEKSRGG